MKTLEKNITSLYGEKGQQWLAALPQLVEQAAIAQKLSDLQPVKNLSYNYVVYAIQDTQHVILKLSPDIEGLKREANALKAFEGFGIVKVLAENEGMLLLERCISGISLKSMFPQQDDEAIRITCECLKRLHHAAIPVVHQFPRINEWLSVLDNNLDIPAQYLHKARERRDHLLQTSNETVLLHGDLHHENILKHGNEWKVIDPKGVIGDLAYDVAAFIRNPMPELLALDTTTYTSIIHHRILQFAQILALPAQRILDWCFVQAVLAWVWAIEDGCDVTYFKQLTDFFAKCPDSRDFQNSI